MAGARTSARSVEDVVDAYAAGASIRELASATGQSRAAIRAVIVAAGYSPAARGAGRPRPRRRLAVSNQLSKRIRSLYVEHRLSRHEIAEQLDIPEHTIRIVLERLGIKTRTRGRLNREDRTRIPPSELERLYVRQQLTMAQVAAKLGTSLSVVAASLHDFGIGVRRPTGRAHSEEVRVLNALYRDCGVLAVLARHGVPSAAMPGQLAERLPERVPLTEALVRELYLGCGLSAVHIEMLTGNPAVEVYRTLTRFGIPRRSAGGLSPWRRRVSGLDE